MVASISFHWFHWFDLVVVLVGGVGAYLGRHGPAAKYIIGFVRWLFVLLICSVLYSLPTVWIAPVFGMRPDILALIIYPLTVPAVYLALGFAWRASYGRTLKMECFGNKEHYVSMFAGMLRSLVILFVVMAWINGRYVTEDDLQKYEVFSQENFGSLRWPVLSTVQRDVFVDAYTGKLARRYVSALLVTPFPPPPSVEDPAALADEELIRERKMKAAQADAPDGAEGIIDELENGRGKKRTPRSKVPVVQTPAVSNAAPVVPIVYHQLTLKGISGTGNKRLALINNQTLKEGESASVKVDTQKVKVFCKEIRDSSVLIEMDGKPEIFELLLGGGQTTNSVKGVGVK
ncbi:MAG: Colicin production protein [Verrucomicrobiales bacterium]|nr:Colicin production protein [Verrucomicrobiales bacterium]